MIETGNIEVINTYYTDEGLFGILDEILSEEFPKNKPRVKSEEEYRFWLRSRGYLWGNNKVFRVTNRQKYDTNFFCHISENHWGERYDYVLVFKEDPEDFTDYILDLLEEQLL